MRGKQLVLDAAGVVPIPSTDGAGERGAGPASLLATELVDALTERNASSATWSHVLLRLALAVREDAGGRDQAAVSREDSARVTRDTATRLDDGMLRARIRYDEFFQVRRVGGLSAQEFRLGVLDTVARSCEDVAAAPIGLTELTDLLRSVGVMLTVVEQVGPEMDRGPTSAAPSAAPSDAEGGTDEERALRRWVTGHHLFALCCEFGRRHLVRAERDLEGGDPETVADDLALAEVFVRAVGAAMTYAATMPRSIYVRHVRPLMNAASGTAHGFSGVDNYDYLLMRDGWERLHRALVNGTPTAARDPRVESAAISLFAAIVEENERHTLIAAAMVGTAPSLKQVHEVTPIAGGQGTPAVESLRQNTDQRRELLDALIARIGMPFADGSSDGSLDTRRGRAAATPGSAR